jgi:hypothetical protein
MLVLMCYVFNLAIKWDTPGIKTNLRILIDRDPPFQ